MNAWEKVQTIAVSASAIAVPIVLAILGNQYNAAIKEREVQGKFVELAVSILVQPPKDESRLIREWATTVVNRYSGVPLADNTRAQLIDKLSLPHLLGGEIVPALNFGVLKMDLSTLSEARSLLAELGYRVPSAAAQPSFETMKEILDALRQFQRDQGIPPNYANQGQTLERLRQVVEARRRGNQTGTK